MDEFFSTLVYLIPMAFFIFFRLRAARGKQEKAAASGGKAGLTRPRGKIIESGTPSERAGRKARGRTRPVPAEPVRETDFSPFLARILPKGLYEELRGTAVRPVSPAAVTAPQQHTVPPTLVPRAAERPAAHAAAASPAAPPVYRDSVKEGRKLPASKRVENLSPWKKAVIMAELLGKPKGW